jgi:hypothetical protein
MSCDSTPAYRIQTPVTVTTSLATCSPIDIRDASSGQVQMPTSSSITSLTWYTSEAVDGTFQAAQDSSGALVQTVAQAKAYPIPSALFGAGFLKAVGNAAGTFTACLKS